MKNVRFVSKMMHRMICVLLSIMLILVCAGCSKGDSSSDAKNGDENDITAGTGKKTFEELGLPKLDIKKDKVLYLCWHGSSEMDGPEDMFYHINSIMKEYYDVELEFVATTYEQLPTRAAQMVLSGQSPDIIQYKPSEEPSFINNNIAQPINDYIPFDNKWFKDKKEYMERYAVNGKNYTIKCGEVTNNGVIYYWKDKFVEAGEKTPWELYQEDKWTWSKFRELAKKFTVDANNDGTPEVYGCEVDPMNMYMTSGEDLVKVQDDGTYVNNMKSSGVAKAMSFLQAIGPSGDNSNGGNGGRFSKQGSVMLWGEAYVSGQYVEHYNNGTMEFAPSPKMDGADKYYVPGKMDTDWFAAGAPNPEGVVAYMISSMLLWDDPYINNEYNKVINKVKDYTPEAREMCDARFDEINNNKKFVRVLNRMSGVGNWNNSGMWGLMDEISKWGTPWTTCLEKYYSKFQSEIDTANIKS